MKTKTICDKCENRKSCPTMDRARGMACKDFETKKGGN